MLEETQRHKDQKTLGEPFRTYRLMELSVERARAMYCFYQHKILKRSLRDIAKEQGMSYERVRHLSDRAKNFYGVTEVDFILL